MSSQEEYLGRTEPETEEIIQEEVMQLIRSWWIMISCRVSWYLAKEGYWGNTVFLASSSSNLTWVLEGNEFLNQECSWTCLVDLLSLSQWKGCCAESKVQPPGLLAPSPGLTQNLPLVGFPVFSFFLLCPQGSYERAFSLSCLSWNKRRPLRFLG